MFVIRKMLTLKIVNFVKNCLMFFIFFMNEKFNVFLISSEGKIGMYIMDPLTRKSVPYWYTPKEFKVLCDNNVDIYNSFTSFKNHYEF